MQPPAETLPARILNFCPRCGADGFAPQPDHSFRCPACGLHFFINAAAAVAALIEDHHGRLLLTRRAHAPARGTLDLPGGFVDPLETAETALRREIREELNLELATCTYLGSFPNQYVFSGLTYFTLDLAFHCSAADLQPLQAGDDALECLFLPPDEINPTLIGLDSIRTIVTTYLAGQLTR